MPLHVILPGFLQEIRYEQHCSCQNGSDGAERPIMKSYACAKFVAMKNSIVDYKSFEAQNQPNILQLTVLPIQRSK